MTSLVSTSNFKTEFSIFKETYRKASETPLFSKRVFQLYPESPQQSLAKIFEVMETFLFRIPKIAKTNDCAQLTQRLYEINVILCHPSLEKADLFIAIVADLSPALDLEREKPDPKSEKAEEKKESGSLFIDKVLSLNDITSQFMDMIIAAGNSTDEKCTTKRRKLEEKKS
ncbi:MAG: hypothetical protein V4487_00580 [Chlamydiota bacterium]